MHIFYYYHYLGLSEVMPDVKHLKYGLLTIYLGGGELLHQGILKWVYKAGNMVNWHDLGLNRC